MKVVKLGGNGRKGRAGRVLATLAAVAVVSGVLPMPEAQAHRRDFPFTYDWQQPSKGEREVELHSRYRGEDNSFQQQVEFEYGVTDRFAVAPYLVFERGSGENLKYKGWKLESRYQLGEYKTGEVLPGLYFEVADEKDEPVELEGKLILSHYNKKGGNLSFNYIVEKKLDTAEEFENIYSFGYAQPLGGGRYDLRGGFEWIHSLENGHINAGPVLGAALGKNVFVTAGYAFKLNRRSTNGDQVRLLAEYEF